VSRLSIPEIRRKLVARPFEGGEEAPAAVATVLREGAEGAELLVIKRAERAGDPWSGHLAFPGGKREARDASLLDTAVRETEEEVGLSLAPGALVTRLGDVDARSTGLRVAQFVFTLDAPAAPFTLSAEVTRALWAPLGRLARLEGAETYTFTTAGGTFELPSLRIEGEVLWGMTYRMLMQLLEALGER
jgi:8-oxo-dGTP pyrophosphatase MutT (NUDIX family)